MAFKFVCLALALSLAPTAVLGQKLRTLTKPACNGPNERLVATGGGCYVDTNGVQQCAPSPPPRCECTLGFERNSATQKCEAAPGASLRSVRDTDSQEPQCGPHEMLYITKGSKQPSSYCDCEPGFKRDAATKKCVTDPNAAGSVRTTRDLKEKLPDCGENAHILPVIGGCYINKDGQHDCSHRHAPICVCNSGFIRNVATKKCDVPSLGAAPGAAPGDSKEKLPDCGENASILPIIGGCFVNEQGVHDCSQRHPPICVCNSGFTRNPTTQKCDVPSLGAVRAGRDTASQDPPCNGPHEMLYISKGCPIDDNGNRDCSKKIPNQCGCEPGYKRDTATNKCVVDPTSAGSVRTTRDLKEKLPECGENEHIFHVIGGCGINAQGQHDCSQRVPSFCVCNSGFIRNAATKKCDVPSLGAAPGAAPASGDSKDKLPDCGENASILPIIGGCFINEQGQHDCSQRQPPICVCNSGFTRNSSTNKCDVPSLGTA